MIELWNSRKPHQLLSLFLLPGLDVSSTKVTVATDSIWKDCETVGTGKGNSIWKDCETALHMSRPQCMRPALSGAHSSSSWLVISSLSASVLGSQSPFLQRSLLQLQVVHNGSPPWAVCASCCAPRVTRLLLHGAQVALRSHAREDFESKVAPWRRILEFSQSGQTYRLRPPVRTPRAQSFRGRGTYFFKLPVKIRFLGKI